MRVNWSELAELHANENENEKDVRRVEYKV